jgi:hypothetical protein
LKDSNRVVVAATTTLREGPGYPGGLHNLTLYIDTE